MDESLCDTFELHASSHVLRRSDEHIICTYITYTYIHVYAHTYTVYIHKNIKAHTFIYYTFLHTNNTYIHTYIHTHIYKYMYIYMHTYIQTHKRPHTNIRIYVLDTRPNTYKHKQKYTYMYVHTHTFIHTHIHIHIQRVYDYPVNYITLTTVSNIGAHMVAARPTYQVYILKRTVLCQVLAVFLLSPFLF